MRAYVQRGTQAMGGQAQGLWVKAMPMRQGSGARTGERAGQAAAPELLDHQALHQRGHRAGRAEAVAVEEKLHCQRCAPARAVSQPWPACRSVRLWLCRKNIVTTSRLVSWTATYCALSLPTFT